MLERVISGGQTGADEAGLIAAKMYGLKTGGYMPDGFKTKVGDRPEFADIYRCYAVKGAGYAAITSLNVYHSDATIRFACNFQSQGERCVLAAIKQFNKPYHDVDMRRHLIGMVVTQL